LAHKRNNIYRAVLESVAYGIRHNIETFTNIGAEVKRVVAVGGGTKSRTWLQIVSDVAGIVQFVPALTIGASYGDALLAGIAAGILKPQNIQDWVKPGQRIDPDESQRMQYDVYYNDYLALYHQTKDIVHHLSASS